MAEITIKLSSLVRPYLDGKGDWYEAQEILDYLEKRLYELAALYPGLKMYRDYDFANDEEYVRIPGLPDDVAQEIIGALAPKLEPGCQPVLQPAQPISNMTGGSDQT